MNRWMDNPLRAKLTKLLVILVILMILLLALLFVRKKYTVTTVYVNGNTHYTDEEIRNMVMTGRLGDNSLYLSFKYRGKGISGVPFVETMEVEILSPDTIRITVYEKALAGCILFLDRYMYFDKDGIVVESSSVATPTVPVITGLSFDHVILHEPLPVENAGVFKEILDITNLLDKYELQADSVLFEEDGNVTLLFYGDNIRVRMGGKENIDEKFMKLDKILPELSDKKGELKLENYTGSEETVIFVSS
ncbi:MAG: FtsQ-type POTRA domain-containing protein [Lachnospiraceae bacterium]|nr:FtsQ-type POTRA domain-containing protein [Lachnospiraceae bacterium]